MKTIQEIIEDYKDYETFLEDRFGRRFCDFLTNEQAEKIGFRFKDGYVNDPVPWTEENVLKQLKEDVEFGWEKCCDERGISAELMYEVVKAWCKVLENGLENISYYGYGREMFKSVAKHYGWELAA